MPVSSEPIATEQEAAIVDLRFADWRRLPAIDLDAAAKLLGKSLMERARQKRIPEDRQRFLQAHLLLQHHVADKLNLPTHDIELVCPAEQKPRLQSPGRQVDISLTHAGGWVGSAIVTGSARIGIDIENTAGNQSDIDLVQQHFAASEIACLTALAPGQRSSAFLSYWTGKEAVIKALGLAVGVTLDAIALDLSPDALTPIDVRFSGMQDPPPGNWHFIQHHLPDGSRLTAACHTTTASKPIWQLKMIDRF